MSPRRLRRVQGSRFPSPPRRGSAKLPRGPRASYRAARIDSGRSYPPVRSGSWTRRECGGALFCWPLCYPPSVVGYFFFSPDGDIYECDGINAVKINYDLRTADEIKSADGERLGDKSAIEPDLSAKQPTARV